TATARSFLPHQRVDAIRWKVGVSQWRYPMESRPTFELAITLFELAGVGVLVIGAIVSLVVFVGALVRRQDTGAAYVRVRQQLERAILLGLEVFIIADIIQSVAVELSFQSIGALGLLIVVRTFLSWSLEVEIEGRWPWQQGREKSAVERR
ncbi:MAG TPA: DUF1622 domain-containing protein, partial [Chloroflexota bacterium]|nr:DUF1622 domain-containing protein [Chloroflexota bacterium]